ncbi:MAG TPA: hypothetical protein VK667_08550, partial [Ktedonobacteraceae bacterium]|nr:hypothetical protein [Ktedonobacteraceae bacterium]
MKVVDATSGRTLASSTAFSNGTAFVDVGKYNMPINANVVVYDTTGTNILASTSGPAGIYGGDVFNVGDSRSPQTTITVNSFDTTLGTSISGIYTTISRGQTNVATGFTPISYTGDRDTEYTIIPQDYQTHLFDHWNDGSIYRAKIIDPSTANVNLTAYYIEGHATATSIAPGESTTPPGSRINFTATVTDQSGSSPSTPVGNLAFNDGSAGGSFSSSVCNLNGTGSCTTTYTVPNGSFAFPLTITGTYSPSSSDTTHKGSYGSATITVGTPPSAHPTSITITPNPARVLEGDQ